MSGPPGLKSKALHTRRQWLEMSRANQLTARRAASMVLGLAFPLVEVLNSPGSGTSTLVPIIVLALGLVPDGGTSVGQEVHNAMLLVFSNLLVSAYGLFVVSVSGVSAAGFLLLVGCFSFVSVSLAYYSPALWVLPIVLNNVVLAVVSTQTFAIVKSDDGDFSRAIPVVMGGSYSFFVGTAIHVASAVFIFPWYAEHEVKKVLSGRWTLYGEVLRLTEQVYNQVARITIHPEERTKWLFLDANLREELRKARQAELQASMKAKSLLIPALLESRWRCSTRGLQYVEMYRVSNRLIRLLRSSADDALQRFNRIKDYDLVRQQKEMRSVKGYDGYDDLLQVLASIMQVLSQSSPLLSMILEPQKSEHEIDGYMSALLAKQDELELKWAVLEQSGLKWVKEAVKRHLIDAPPRHSRLNGVDPLPFTILLNFLPLLAKIIEQQRELVTHMDLNRPWRANSSPNALKHKWVISLFNTNLDVYERDTLRVFATSKTFHERTRGFISNLYAHAKDVPFVIGLKFSIGMVLLTLPAYLEGSQDWFSEVQATNAVFTFAMILFKLRTGVVLERTAHRVVGITLGGLYVGLSVELACVNGCVALDGWSIFLLALLPLALYLWLLRKHPSISYMGFALVRTHMSTSIPFILEWRSGLLSAPSMMWRSAGLVILSSYVGALVAIFVGVIIWPTSGRDAFRHLMGNIFVEFELLYERCMLLWYEGGPKECPEVSAELELAEALIANEIFLATGPLLRSIELESKQRVHVSGPSFKHYEKAAQSAQHIWRYVWKFHHIAGIRMKVHDGNDYLPNRIVRPLSVRRVMMLNRFVSDTFSVLSSTLLASKGATLPALRPMCATPHLVTEALNDIVLGLYKDVQFTTQILASNDLLEVANVVVFRETMINLSYSLETLFEFLEQIIPVTVNAERLREKELEIFALFTHKGDIDSPKAGHHQPELDLVIQ